MTGFDQKTAEMMYRRMNPKELEKLIKQMEEMANAPKEEIGKRTPGELASYEKTVPTKDLRGRPILDRP